MSAAANPAAPPPTRTIRSGAPLTGRGFAAVAVRFPATKILLSRSSTVQQAKIETGVVQGAAHGVADEKAVGECAVIMRAQRVDREHFAPATYE